jgi:hypothetical protein
MMFILFWVVNWIRKLEAPYQWYTSDGLQLSLSLVFRTVADRIAGRSPEFRHLVTPPARVAARVQETG